MSKVSILIAAFNVEEYISEALASVVAQTMSDIEIIVVDDCSTDSTSEIVRKYASLDSRIKVVRNVVNSSLMQVRQIGLREASGEYIMFLDGDDVLEPRACEIAYREIKRQNVEMLQFDTNVLFVGELLEPKEQVEVALRNALKSIPHKVVSPSEHGLIDGKYVKGSINFNVWNKIYKRDLLERVAPYIPAEYINMAEDVLFSYIVQYFAKSFSNIPDRLYGYRFGCGMSTSTKLSERQLQSIAKNAYVYNYLKQFTVERHAEKNCRETLRRAHQQLYEHIVNTYFYNLQENQYKQFMEIVSKYGDRDDIVLALSNYIYAKRVSQEDAAIALSDLDFFVSDKKEIKTVGVFYFRMYNGGIERVISSISDTWVKNGYRVILFTDEEPNKNDYYINDQIKRVVLPAMKDNAFTTHAKRIKAFRHALIEENVDVMVYNAWGAQYLLLDEMIVKSCGVKLIVHTHNLFSCEFDSTDPWTAHYYATLKTLYRFVDTVITLTDVDTAWWSMLGMRAIKTVNPIQLSFDTPVAKLQGHNVLCSGRIDSLQKQTLHAVKVIHRVREKIPDATLTLIGGCDEPGYKAKIKQYIAENNLKDAVKMIGYTQDVLSYYQDADVMLCTSKYEGFSLSLTESKMCGLPLVCYYLSNWDMARDPKGMVNIPQGNIEAAADAIVEILQDADLKQKMGREARQSAEELLSIDLAKHWDEIFAKTLEPRVKAQGVEIKSLEETAVNIALDAFTRGISNRGSSGMPMIQSEQYRALIDTIQGLERSESYRLGLWLTAIPRRIKRWLKK